VKRAGIACLIVFVAAACTGRPADDATGEEIYLQLCSNCHGDDMAGGIGPNLGPDSSSALQPDEFLEISILRGRGRMPSFRSSLNDEQLERLIGHIRMVQDQ
jgi:mono/diheme cytochrome c family protein